MEIILAALTILLTMPISYAMLDEAVRKIRIKRPRQRSE
jgi:multisubunit Na+/H+ antiporter MnhG subunit